MCDTQQIRDAFDAAGSFLNPVLQKEELQKSRGSSLLKILSGDSIDEALDENLTRTAVVGKALDILTRIHSAFVSPIKDAGFPQPRESEDAALEDAKRRRLLHALLDLISLEGIYPSLSSGAGIPLQQRVISVLPAGVIAHQPQKPPNNKPQNEVLLERIMSVLSDIICDERRSIQPVIRGRILSDIISAASDLASNAEHLSQDKKQRYRDVVAKVVEETPSPVLLSTLSSFLQSDTAPWFKSIVSSQISRVPLRQDGVLQTILFLASQLAPSLGQESQDQTSNGPHFTVQAIMQSSRLLSSVPQGLDPVDYFSIIGPQLLALIDGDDPDLRKTAAYVVGNGILCKRAYGAPGTIGHSIFLEPLFKTLTAGLDDSSRNWMMSSSASGEDLPNRVLVPESLLVLAVDRLRSLVLQPPNPSLVKRVVYPILVPLWGLACGTSEQQRNSLHEKIMEVLQTYFAISVGEQPLKKLVDNLLWDGGSTWTYSVVPTHGLSLIKRETAKSDRLNIVRLLDTLASRAKLFVGLLGADPSSEERTGDIFLYVSESWLVSTPVNERSFNKPQLGLANEAESMERKLVSAKLAETLLDNFKDILSRRPLRVLELIKQIIDGEFNRASTRKKRDGDLGTGKVSLSSLANIVPAEENTEQGNAEESDSTESLPAVFSLLSTVLASPEFSASEDTLPVLETLKSRLDQLIPYLPPSLAKPGTTSSMLLEIHMTSPTEQSQKRPYAEVSDFETHRRALTNLNSDLPPVQAEGFSLLSDLVKKSSPVLDIPSTLTLLLSIITDPSEAAANDEFIYLNAIKLIGTLASRHPRTVVKTLVDRYTDRNETTNLDQRLKIGESLLRTVQDLGQSLTGETAKVLGDGMIAVAGRRSQKPETQKRRKQQLEKEKRQKEREERRNKEPAMPSGWKISSPSPAAKLQEDEEEGSESESPEQAAHSANIIAAWAAGASADDEPDDLRARASALSILATAVQTNIAGLGPSVASSAVDLALATLTLEQEPESAILRRASVVLLLDILKALDTTRETRGSQALGFGFSLADDSAGGMSWKDENASSRGPSTIGNIPHMLRTLAFVESRETDTIVRGHIRVLIESLEAWVEKSLLWGIGAHDREGENEPRLELGDRIAGLQIDPLAGRQGSGRPRIEEIE
ncbi:protein required for cell viability [Aspergillus flavus]|uniref:Protein required for cell viability n=3 Tax=Aspergillus subgen. Circumdati TaxID=2720871 RepID=A0A7U2MKC3_ASPFN|nr:uncharacterized protein G4B84_004409 [Aspergillus flavus NRRL3357]KAB8243649.1 hypothetical protein BDV35DRAFT_313419 [Aspergillus flavus]KAF7617680.1 hypothetical protein AFLA_006594 [Aspergillus flavus NRRL3357]QMW29074.1 hypothetical protein G4B84_004409 [Aspergillus flavus NRRL3357]QMW41149.1 hypothetical protein G4B11_004473 [Aspergillus flavus]QRD85354.1 protein required for cell viability [Aspergillus flavus]